jgi:hypothetical protein
MARLQNTGLTDEGLLAIRDLEFLEVLNIFGDPVTDAGLANLGTLPALKRLYAWQTGITPNAVDSLRGVLPRLEVILGGDDQ